MSTTGTQRRYYTAAISALTALSLAACGGGGGGGGGQTAAAGAGDQSAPAAVPGNTPPNSVAPATAPAPAPAPASAPASAPALLVQAASMVNTTTAGQQNFRSVSAQSDGGYAVSWVSDTAPVAIQRYDSAGNKVGGETSLVIDPPAVGQVPAVTVLTNGEIVAASAIVASNGDLAISISRFDAGGVLIGQTDAASLTPRPTTGRHHEDIALVPLANGGFALGWSVFDLADNWSMFTQRFDSQGVAIGEPVQVGANVIRFPSIRLTPDVRGGYTMQVSRLPPGASGGPFGELSELVALVHFDANGTELEVLRPTQGSSLSALLVPLADGRFVLFTLDSRGSSPNRQTLSRQFLDGAGNRVGDPVVVTFNPAVLPTFPSPLPVAGTALADGSYVVFLQADGGGFTAQRFDANGAALGDAVAVDAVPGFPDTAVQALGRDAVSSAAFQSGGGLTLAWSATGPGGDADVFTQRVLVQN